MAESINYGAGESAAIAQGYSDLRAALASKGEAENRRKAREIERKGLFGSGIKQSDLQDFGNIAIKGAEFGEARMGRKMDRATKSFDRRMKADERRLATLQARHDKGQLTEAGIAELDGLQFGMKERRDSFEDFMGKYQEKGLWGTSFGGDDVGYRTEGESKYSQAMRPKPGSGPKELVGSGREGIGGRGDERIGPREDMPVGWSPDVVPEWRRGEGDERIGPREDMPVGWSPDVVPEWRRGGGMMNLGDRGFKKKADLVGTSGGIAERETGSNKFDPNPELGLGESRISRIGKNPARLPMSGALRDRTPLQRRRDDVLEKRKLIADKKRALEQNKLEQKQMTDEILAKRQTNKLTEALREIDWKRG